MRPLPFISLLLASCGGSSATPDGPDSDQPDAALINGCALTENTTQTSTVNSGCALLERDTSSCEADRRAAGLDGLWLKFSCRVTITKSATQVLLASDARPDTLSNYFPAGDVCHVDYTPEGRNPNMISIKHMTLKVPSTPALAGANTGLGTIGFAVNGVALFNNRAAGTDDIYVEALGFDQCQGHPTGQNLYHYHSEPYSITYDDANLVGVLMDGFPVYGRRDVDGSLPSDLDASGGHTGPTQDSATAVYHYHINLQTSMTAGTAGKQAWFITTGHYAGTPGTCEGCQ